MLGEKKQDFLTTKKLIKLLKKADPTGKMVVVVNCLSNPSLSDHYNRMVDVKFSRKKNVAVIKKSGKPGGELYEPGYKADLLGLSFVADQTWV